MVEIHGFVTGEPEMSGKNRLILLDYVLDCRTEGLGSRLTRSSIEGCAAVGKSFYTVLLFISKAHITVLHMHPL
jgi:hypothetical protein